MAMQFDDAFTPKIIKDVQQIITTCNKSGARTSGWEEFQNILLEKSLAWYATTPPEFCGVHPDNRSKLGVSGAEAHHHGQDILQEGFSWKKASDAAAFESPPEPHNQHAKEANDKFVDVSHGYIPPLKQLKLLSVGGGHTNTFLRAVKAGVKSAVDKLADTEGNLSAEKLCVDRPAFRDAINKGLHWFVMHWQCQFVWKDLPQFVQAALNTQSRGAQTEVEIMLSMHMACEHALANKENPDWQKIQEQACFSLPPCASYISSVAAYVKKNSGGTDASLLHDLSLFQKSFAPSGNAPNRILGSEFLNKLATLNFGPSVQFPYTINACIKANLVSPPSKLIDGVCKLLMPANLQSLTLKTNRVLVTEAEKLMSDSRKLADVLHLESGARSQLLGKLDVRCILHICKKGKEGENREFKSIGDIAEEHPLQRVTCILRSSLAGAAARRGLDTLALQRLPCFRCRCLEMWRCSALQTFQCGFQVHVHAVTQHCCSIRISMCIGVPQGAFGRSWPRN